MWLLIAFIILAYLLGSISSAIIICKVMGYPDPRTEGSKNPGATNVLRVANKTAAIMTLLGDALKGFIPVFIAKLMGLEGISLGFIALAAFIGHLFPIFFGFKGGKGVATYLGCLLGLSWLLGLLAIATWILIAALFRYSSLAAIVMVIATPFYLFGVASFDYFIPLGIMGVILVMRHHANIGRLIHHQETKLGK